MKSTGQRVWGWVVALACAGLLVGCARKKPAVPEPAPKVEKPATPPAKTEKPDPLAEARRKTRANLAAIAKAFDNYEATTKFYPTGLIDPKKGGLGLSWRVQILPYLEGAGVLYEQFKLDEPWDSEHNKKLLAKMPEVYAPVRGRAPAGHTFYQGFADHALGPKGEELPPGQPVPWSRAAFFPDPRPFFEFKPGADLVARTRRGGGIEIADGTTNTFLVAEAGDTVPWTKPEDIRFAFNEGKQATETGRVPKLGGMFDGDFHVAMVDGTIYFIKRDAPREKLRGFVTVAGGEDPDYAGIGLEEPQWLRDVRKKGPPPPAPPAKPPEAPAKPPEAPAKSPAPVARSIRAHSSAYNVRLAFSADGKTLASASTDKTARLWDVDTGKKAN